VDGLGGRLPTVRCMWARADGDNYDVIRETYDPAATYSLVFSALEARAALQWEQTDRTDQAHLFFHKFYQFSFFIITFAN